MFEQTFVQPRSRTRNPLAVAVSLSVQCSIVAILLLMPLLHPEALRLPELPQPRLIRTWIDLPPVPAAQPASPRTATAPPLTAPRPVFTVPNVHADITRHIEVPYAEPDSTAWAPANTAPFGASFSDSLSNAGPLPPRVAVPVPATKPVIHGPLQVSLGVQDAKLLYGPRPTYPTLAKAARSQGIVKMEAIIAVDGSIRNLHVISGPPLLVGAALSAVRQWRYQPTLLNGIAVEVVTEIDVNFTLTDNR